MCESALVSFQTPRFWKQFITNWTSKRFLSSVYPYVSVKNTCAQYFYQRSSRGHKARGQGQGHKKIPRPRTAFPRTDPLEAKDRNARGQGQEPRTQAQVFSKTKRSPKKFFRQSPIYGRSQNFWLGRPKPQITCNDVIKNLPVAT